MLPGMVCIYMPCDFSLLLMFTHRKLHKYLVLKESITSTTYITCFPFPLVLRNSFYFTLLSVFLIFFIIMIIMSIIITVSVLTALEKKKILETQGKGNHVVSHRLTNWLDVKHLWSHLCANTFHKQGVKEF